LFRRFIKHQGFELLSGFVEIRFIFIVNCTEGCFFRTQTAQWTCAANGRLEHEDRQYVYNEIRVLQKRRT